MNKKTSAIKGKLIQVVFLSLILIFLFSTVSPLFAQLNPRCQICGKKITGMYWKTGNKVVCNTCYKSAPKCYKCGMPSKKTRMVDGHRICPDCLSKLQKCERCGRPMYTYWYIKNSDGVKHKYCNECRDATMERCDRCHQPISGIYWKKQSNVTDKTGTYCQACKDRAKECFACGLFTGKNSRPLPDGRWICDECLHSAINAAEYEKIYKEMQSFFPKELGLRVHHTPRFHVVNRKRLDRVKMSVGKITNDEVGFYKCSKITRKSLTGRKTTTLASADIYVLSHLPRTMAFWVIAHEYAHGWYEERVNKKKDKLIVEGFAQWVAWHALKKKGLDNIARKLTERKDDYGKGLRLLLKIEKKYGYNAVIKYVTK